MLENITRPGMDTSWLPVWEDGSPGTGKECSHGALDVNFKGTKGKYLPFVKNGINYVESNGMDVISFNFTGCIMAVYTKGGSRRVCHVSTGSQQDCKGEWEKIKAASKDVKEFKPSDAIDSKKLGGAALKGCYGIITAEGKCFAVVVADKGGKSAIVDLKAL
jgi:hypothetical protein